MPITLEIDLATLVAWMNIQNTFRKNIRQREFMDGILFQVGKYEPPGQSMKRIDAFKKVTLKGAGKDKHLTKFVWLDVFPKNHEAIGMEDLPALAGVQSHRLHGHFHEYDGSEEEEQNPDKPKGRKPGIITCWWNGTCQ